MTRPEQKMTEQEQKNMNKKCELHSEMKQCNKGEDYIGCQEKQKEYGKWNVKGFSPDNCNKNREGEWKYSPPIKSSFKPSFSGGKSKRKSKKNKKSKRKTKKNKRKTRKNKRK